MLKRIIMTQRKDKLSFVKMMFVLLCVALPSLTFAQAGFETSIGGAGPDTGIVDAPIDGGTVFLIAAGVIFGIYRLYKFAVAKGAPSLN